jgi:hypothetical protein
MSTDRGNFISLESFDPNSRKEPILNSPRSIEACRRQGIEPNELLIRTNPEIKDFFKHKKLDPEGLDLICKHYEERRREKVRVLLEEREQLIEDEKNGLVVFDTDGLQKRSKEYKGAGSVSKSKYGGSMVGGESALIEREKRQLEKIRLRQEKEIKQIMDHEAKLAEIRNKQEDKMQQQADKDRQREHELMQKRAEQEELRRQKEQEKKQRADEEAEMQKQLAQEAYEKEQEKMQQEKERERMRQIEFRRKEEEQKQKHEEFIKKTEEKLLEQQMRVEQRKAEMEMKDQIRLEMMRRQQEEKLLTNEEKRIRQEQRLKIAKEKNEELMYGKKQEFDEKFIRNEERRKAFELEKEQKAEETRMRAEMHAQLIKKVLEGNSKNLEERREQSLAKRSMADDRKRELDRIAEIERKQKLEAEREKEEQRKGVKSNMEYLQKAKVDEYTKKFEETEIKVATVQKMKHDEHKTKNHINTIKKIDKEENVRRIAKMQEYQRQKNFRKDSVR